MKKTRRNNTIPKLYGRGVCKPLNDLPVSCIVVCVGDVVRRPLPMPAVLAVLPKKEPKAKRVIIGKPDRELLILMKNIREN